MSLDFSPRAGDSRYHRKHYDTATGSSITTPYHTFSGQRRPYGSSTTPTSASRLIGEYQSVRQFSSPHMREYTDNLGGSAGRSSVRSSGLEARNPIDSPSVLESPAK